MARRSRGPSPGAIGRKLDRVSLDPRRWERELMSELTKAEKDEVKRALKAQEEAKSIDLRSP